MSSAAYAGDGREPRVPISAATATAATIASATLRRATRPRGSREKAPCSGAAWVVIALTISSSAGPRGRLAASRDGKGFAAAGAGSKFGLIVPPRCEEAWGGDVRRPLRGDLQGGVGRGGGGAPRRGAGRPGPPGSPFA